MVGRESGFAYIVSHIIAAPMNKLCEWEKGGWVHAVPHITSSIWVSLPFA